MNYSKPTHVLGCKNNYSFVFVFSSECCIKSFYFGVNKIQILLFNPLLGRKGGLIQFVRVFVRKYISQTRLEFELPSPISHSKMLFIILHAHKDLIARNHFNHLSEGKKTIVYILHISERVEHNIYRKVSIFMLK